jgi:hypothetical protein
MCADIHDGQEQKRSIQGPDTEAQDQASPDHHIQLATHGAAVSRCNKCVLKPGLLDHLVGAGEHNLSVTDQPTTISLIWICGEISV